MPNIKSTISNIITKLYDYIILFLFLVAVIFSFLAIPDKWVELINFLWVDPVMSKLTFCDIYVLSWFLILLIVYYSYQFLFIEAIDKTRVCVIFVYSIGYTICYTSKEWVFYSTYCNIPWCHFTYLPLLLELILFAKINGKQSQNIPPMLLAEKTTKIEDTFKRKEFISTTANILETCYFEDNSFSVAITGTWGSGKTTFLNRLHEEFSNETTKIDLFYFEPWKNDSPESIMKSFFSLLSKKLDKYFPHISSDIYKYVSILVDETPSNYKYPLQLFQSIVLRRHSTMPFERIKRSLRESKHKVAIFIDDIDRLEADEIKEVLRLIRNTANFPYLQFIVAFDKEYVINTLSSCGINNAELYLEKFFNIEIGLPSLQDTFICSEIKKNISPIINEVWGDNINSKELDNMIYYRTDAPTDVNVNYYLIPKIIKSQRDVIRFINSFKLMSCIYKSKNIESEISFKDLFFLELLKYRFYDVYMLLYYDPLSILKEDRESKIFALNEDILQKKVLLNYSDYNKEICTSILKKLLKGYDRDNSFLYVRNFGRYFMVAVDEKHLTLPEFFSLISLSNDDLEEKALLLYKKKNHDEFRLVIKYVLSRIPMEIESYESIYSALKKLCMLDSDISLKKEASDAVVDHVLSMSCKDSQHFKSLLDLFKSVDSNILLKISEIEITKFFHNILFKQNLVNKLNANNLDQEVIEAIRDFIICRRHSLFVSRSLSKFINSSKEIDANDLVISIKELIDIQILIFDNYKEKLSYNGLEIFRICMLSTKEANTDDMKNKVLEIMRVAIKEDPLGYLDIFVQPIDSEHNSNVISPDPYYLEIFKDVNQFDSFISAYKDDTRAEKAYNFWQLFKCNGYNGVILADTQSGSNKILNDNFKECMSSLHSGIVRNKKYNR